MCRHLGWLGHPRQISDFVTEPPHSLVVQSYAARELLRGRVCGDGFGIGWYPEGDPEPARYRRELPIWADPDLDRFAGVVRSRAIVAAVRNGTPGIPGGLASTQPCTHGQYACSHNGFIAQFPTHARRLRGALPEDLYAALTGESDSETFFLLALMHIRRQGDLVAGVEAAIRDVIRQAPGSAFCVVITDGHEMAAARIADGQPCDSLYVRRDADGTTVASEPLEASDSWTALPQNAVTRITTTPAPMDGVW